MLLYKICDRQITGVRKQDNIKYRKHGWTRIYGIGAPIARAAVVIPSKTGPSVVGIRRPPGNTDVPDSSPHPSA